MELPILYALTHPERLPDTGVRRFDPVAAGPLTFEPVRTDVFRAFHCGVAAGRTGGTAPAVFNAANEVAVAAFLEGCISFGRISGIIEGVLDAHRPELFDAPYIEVGSFHESFGDMSAILSALQLPSIRAAAMSGIKGRKSSQLSRLAEQLGWALRKIDPSLVNKDCLRNAYHSFNYVDPDTLPDDAPASKLCAEVHSFSRVFTGAFYDILSAMLKIRSANPTAADLVAAWSQPAAIAV
jgi:hypothetical protein